MGEETKDCLTAEALQAQLDGFRCTEHYYSHPLAKNVVYTDGVKFLADGADAWWLVSDLCINIAGLHGWLHGHDTFGMEKSPSIELGEKDSRLKDMQFWTLTVHEDGTSELVCRPDSGEPAALTQRYVHTRLPVGEWKLWAQFNGSQWVVMLPSEY